MAYGRIPLKTLSSALYRPNLPNIDGNFTLIVTSDTPNTTLTGHVTGANNTIIMNVSSGSGGGSGVDCDGGDGTQKAMPWVPLLLDE